jgi:hypothetical protein
MAISSWTGQRELIFAFNSKQSDEEKTNPDLLKEMSGL